MEFLLAVNGKPARQTIHWKSEIKEVYNAFFVWLLCFGELVQWSRLVSLVLVYDSVPSTAIWRQKVCLPDFGDALSPLSSVEDVPTGIHRLYSEPQSSCSFFEHRVCL